MFGERALAVDFSREEGEKNVNGARQSIIFVCNLAYNAEPTHLLEPLYQVATADTQRIAL